MEKRHLGRTGLQVSRLGLGTMTWGRDTDEHEAAEQLKEFVDAGGNLVDTADVYADGGAEYLISRLTDSLIPRSELVIATKAGSVPESARRFDGSRGHLLAALDASLRRLGTDYVDLWQVHAFDPTTPVEETLSALDIAVSSGRARYAAVCDFSGWQLAKAATWQRAHHTRMPLAGAQWEYSLLQRGIEREALPAALDAGVGILAGSPLGRGVLTGKYRGAPGLARRLGVPVRIRPAVPRGALPADRGRRGHRRRRAGQQPARGRAGLGPRPARGGLRAGRGPHGGAAAGGAVSGGAYASG